MSILYENLNFQLMFAVSVVGRTVNKETRSSWIQIRSIPAAQTRIQCKTAGSETIE
jgi:hypothetical protein